MLASDLPLRIFSILLGMEPTAQVLTLYTACLFGCKPNAVHESIRHVVPTPLFLAVVHLALATVPDPWRTRYNESISISSLNHLSPAIGYIIGTQSCSKLIDTTYVRLNKRHNGIGKPQCRLPVLIPGSLLVLVSRVGAHRSTST